MHLAEAYVVQRKSMGDRPLRLCQLYAAFVGGAVRSTDGTATPHAAKKNYWNITGIIKNFELNYNMESYPGGLRSRVADTAKQPQRRHQVRCTLQSSALSANSPLTFYR